MTENNAEPSHGHDIIFTENAVNRVVQLIAEQNNPNLSLRIFVQGGGCSGFQYGFSFDDVINDDIDLLCDDVRLVVDTMSLHYLIGSVVDFQEDLGGARFTITNPMAVSTCGCGSSFST